MLDVQLWFLLALFPKFLEKEIDEMKTRIRSFLAGMLSLALILGIFGMANATPGAAPTSTPSPAPEDLPETVELRDRTPNQYMMVMTGYEHDEESDLTFAVFKLNDAGKLALLLYQSADVYRFEEALEILHNPTEYKEYQVSDAVFHLRLALERLTPINGGGGGCDYFYLNRVQLIAEGERVAQTDEYQVYTEALKPFADLDPEPITLMAAYAEEDLAEYRAALEQAVNYYRPDYVTWMNDMTFRLPVPSET